MADSSGFWAKLAAGYAYVKGKVSAGTGWGEKRVTEAADTLQNQLDKSDDLGGALLFGVARGASGAVYDAAKGTVETVVDVAEAGGAGAKWVYDNPEKAWQNAASLADSAGDVLSNPGKIAALAKEGGDLVYTKLAGLTSEQWQEFKGEVQSAETPGEIGQVAGKWAAKLGMTVYAVRSAIRALKLICEGSAVAVEEASVATRAATTETAESEALVGREPGSPEGAAEEGSSITKIRTPEVRNGYTFEFDEQGRVSRISGELSSNPDQGRNLKAQRLAGGDDRLSTDHGGHWIGRVFDGPTDDFNHFAQDGSFNQGPYRRLEALWESYLEQGKPVRVDIRPTYPEGSLRPSSLDVRYSVDGAEMKVDFINQAGG